jgi:2-amino-4-hydroxy-6-hydroxymethyldihydropteridine diphosphokinase
MPQARSPSTLGQQALIALGTNLGDPQSGKDRLILSAVVAVCDLLGGSAETSRLYATPAFPVGSGPDFVNAVIRVQTNLAAPDILSRLHRVESDFGRVRDQRWGPRTLDLDLLALGDAVLPDREVWAYWHDLPLDRQMQDAPTELILPHPRLQDRAFVLVPLCDVAPDWRHPVLGRTAAELCADLPQADRDLVIVLN